MSKSSNKPRAWESALISLTGPNPPYTISYEMACSMLRNQLGYSQEQVVEMMVDYPYPPKNEFDGMTEEDLKLMGERGRRAAEAGEAWREKLLNMPVTDGIDGPVVGRVVGICETDTDGRLEFSITAKSSSARFSTLLILAPTACTSIFNSPHPRQKQSWINSACHWRKKSNGY